MPSGDGVSVSGVIAVSGWAIDEGSPSGTGVDRVGVYLDNISIKEARLGEPRSDIGQAYGARFQPAGWRTTLDMGALATPGAHELEIDVRSTVTGADTRYTRRVLVTGPQQFGVNAHLLWLNLSAAVSDLDRIRANGLSEVRVDVAWDALQPYSRGEWSTNALAELDDVLDLIGVRGLRPVLTILGTPGWARHGVGTRMTPPDDPNDFADALSQLAGRYAARPGLVYEVWNEPNQRQFWDTPGGPDSGLYAALLRATYDRVKAAAPGATVLGGSIANNDPAYLEGLYAAGAAGSYDGLALHPYSAAYAPDATQDPAHSFVGAIDTARQTLVAHGDADKSIWITEFGWSTGDVADGARAAYFEKAVALVRARPWIAAMCAYGLNQAEDFPDYGLVAADGTSTARWRAYGAAATGR